MPPKVKIGASIVIFDANSNAEFKTQAIDCYKKISERIFFSDDDSVTKLCLMNAHKEGSKRTTFYATDYVCFNPCNRTHLEAALPAVGNWLTSLERAVDDLYNRFELNLYSKFQIAVLSDLNTPLEMEEEEVRKKTAHIIKTLKEIHGYIYFIGLDVQPNQLLTSKISVYEWAQSITIDKENTNYKIADNIVKGSLGALCDFDVGADLFITYVESARGFPFIEPLSFGDKLKLPTSLMRFIHKPKRFTPRDSTELLNTTFVLSEDHEVIVDFTDIIRGRVLNEKVIFVPKEVSKGIKEYPRFFKLLGFTSSKNVPAHYMFSGNTNILTNYNQTDPEVGYINYVIEAAEKYNKYGIALKAHKKNSRPKLFCLIPKTSPHYFLMVELPYAEDIITFYKEYDPKTYKIRRLVSEDTKVNNESKTDVFAYLDSIYLDDKIRLHPNRRESDVRKRMASIFLDKFEGQQIKQTPLKPFGIEFEANTALQKQLEEKLNKKDDVEVVEDLW